MSRVEFEGGEEDKDSTKSNTQTQKGKSLTFLQS